MMMAAIVLGVKTVTWYEFYPFPGGNVLVFDFKIARFLHHGRVGDQVAWLPLRIGLLQASEEQEVLS